MVDSTPGPTYLIVGGTTKAATTSLFAYLSDHPQICGSTLKETRYFLDPSYPLPIPRSYADEGKEGYERYFRACRAKPVRVEATPDYLYSRRTPKLLRRYLPDVRCVFVLRDPVDRLISWYRFARQNGQISRSVSLEEYVRRQLNAELPRTDALSWRTLKQGRYAKYLRNYLDVLGEDAVWVAFFEQVIENPAQVLRRIARFAGAEPSFFDEYTFDVHNETRSVKSPFVHSLYRRILRAVRYRVHDWPQVHEGFRRLRSWVDSLYVALNETEEDNSIRMMPELRTRLRRYYAEDVADLADMVGRRPPWSMAEAS